MLQSDLFFYLIVVFVILIAVGLIILIHAGFFYTIRIRMITPPVLPHHVAYLLKVEPYKNAGAAFKKLSALAPNATLFGIYYDDDDKLPAQEKPRYIVGCCLPDPQERTDSSSNLEDRLLKHGYQLYTFPSCDKAVVTEYPWRNYLSIFLAIFIVYPAIDKYAKDHNVKLGPCIEYYEKNLIRYIIPLDHLEQFYVPGTEPNESH